MLPSHPPNIYPSPLLRVENLCRNFGGLRAVNQVSFQVQRGEIFGLIGPNGAGKTTAFNLITGLIPVSQGNIYLSDRLLTGLAPHQIAAVGVARTFQNIRLFQDLTVWQNVLLGQHLHLPGGFWANLWQLKPVRVAEYHSQVKIQSLLDWVGLGDRPNSLAGTLAYGDQRRLELARALALEPQVLLLDEPAAGMNPNEKKELSNLIRRLQREFDLTIVLIEHHVPLVMGLCDRIAVLDFGELITVGDPATVQQNPAVIEAYLGAL
ncbi:ABC transporter ATP-binding protein [Candidatus Synechococcus calcipolaris G9]|uniref:ABC transporter ATP-binding protein n=1 Tax=Candidatus Synechococcus calcipolaris G9 TaxID=1497997 RepID=A0ABT6EWV7_9SYNE|nr:ABC transporter ATP-binding protein [Candidatus Synechococcus calcipolaris]MDG2989390.1 ABC transporter ATP-binding protein [Candidatus Synechococcus calcipolaris G9]